MKISEFQNEDAIDLLADLLEPATEIFADAELRNNLGNMTKMEIAKHILKNHKKSIIEVLAIMDGTPVEDYKCNPVSILVDIIKLMSDKELVDFFSSQAKEMANISSILPAENIEVAGK